MMAGNSAFIACLLLSVICAVAYEDQSQVSQVFEDDEDDNTILMQGTAANLVKKRMISSQATDGFTSEEMTALHALFDEDKDGKASLADRLRVSAHISEQMILKDIASSMGDKDVSGDGKLSKQELHMDNSLLPEDAKDAARINAFRKLEDQKFNIADADGDGMLDETELLALVFPETNDGVLALAVQGSIQMKDLDGDGMLNLEEFNSVAVPNAKHQDNIEKEDFRRLDADSNGKLCQEELKVWESGSFHTNRELKRMYDVADKDKDGHVTDDDLDKAKEEIAAMNSQERLSRFYRSHEL